MAGRYLEDFAVGQTFNSARKRIEKERIKSFAAEFDPQVFHLDEEGAPDAVRGPGRERLAYRRAYDAAAGRQ